MSLSKGWKDRQRAFRLRARAYFPMQIGDVPGRPNYEVARVCMGQREGVTIFHAYARKKRAKRPGVTKRDQWTTREVLEEWRDRATMPLHRIKIQTETAT